MKRLILIVVAFFAVMQLNAQKVGYIATETILSYIPQYKTAQSKLEVLNNQYKNEIEAKYKSIEALYQKYQASKASLSAAERQYKEEEIISKEQEVKALQKKYFGQDGAMQKKSEELLNPIKAMVSSAIEKVAKAGNYSLIIDLSAIQGVAYAKADDDLSKAVLAQLGY